MLDLISRRVPRWPRFPVTVTDVAVGSAAELPLATDITGPALLVRFVPILLQKSFWGGDRKFLEPLKRLMRSDVRDHIVSSKIDGGPR
jgi:hypothetical protein